MRKNRRVFYLLVVITLCLCIGFVMFLSACDEEETPTGNNILPKRDKVIETPSDNTSENQNDSPSTDNPDDNMNEEQTTTLEEPVEEEPVVAYTEVEYKQMCEEKLVELAKDSFTAKYPGYALGEIEFKIIDKLNNLVYFVGDYAGELQLIEVSFNENIFDYENYSDLYNNSLKNKGADSNVEFKFRGRIYPPKVTEDSYNTFLDTIVKDQGLKDVLATEGIAIADDANGWLDVASVVNISPINLRSVDVKFIDLNNQKTIEVMVYAELNIQQSANIQVRINNLTIKEKTYTILEVKDFATFPDPA